MAKRIMARRRTPASPAATTTAGTTAGTSAGTTAGTSGPSAADLLENKLEQLRSLLWCCRGEGIEWTAGDGPTHLENMLWIAADLVHEAGASFQQCAGEWEPKG